MARKGKKRRDARRKKEQEPGGAGTPAAPEPGDVEDESPPPPAPAVKNRPARQKKKKRGSTRIRVSPWWFAGVGSVAIVGVVAFLIATSGSSGVSVPQVTAPPDPRVEGLTPAVTLDLEAGGSDVDAYFNPTELTGPTGEAIEIVVENTGTLSHNLTVAGVDNEYGTSDDWVSRPELISPGEEGSLVLKIDDPGTYAFRCSLHPDIQFGELVLQ